MRTLLEQARGPTSKKRKPRVGRPRKPINFRKLVKLAEQGLSIRQMAKKLGVSDRTLRRRIQKMGATF